MNVLSQEHLLQSAVLDEDLAIERLVGLVRALSVSQGVTLINQGLRADAGDRSKRVTIRACIVISQEVSDLPVLTAWRIDQ